MSCKRKNRPAIHRLKKSCCTFSLQTNCHIKGAQPKLKSRERENEKVDFDYEGDSLGGRHGVHLQHFRSCSTGPSRRSSRRTSRRTSRKAPRWASWASWRAFWLWSGHHFDWKQRPVLHGQKVPHQRIWGAPLSLGRSLRLTFLFAKLYVSFCDILAGAPALQGLFAFRIAQLRRTMKYSVTAARTCNHHPKLSPI